MPHLVILYTPQLDAETDLSALCRRLADTMLAQRDAEGRAVFPPGGTRVLAFPAAHHAVSDGGAAGRAAGGNGDYAFVYLNLRMASGRPPAVVQGAGDALLAEVKAHFAPLFAQRHIGITLQVDEGAPAFDGKHSNLHPLFNRAV
ncbi:5-carboxymethyl-2-hydroxymuconate isomerase [Curvibacter sp. RS43]|uniref:5-carboxymethyl-2-hydroxymuconate isomerase n=1 Tax=Curvibacter microcysteis TaxID=3026419 RepID=A0ABT5MD87_9BURK|nr:MULTISPECIES: 5-carboxymethyl-2-hydroxymuconate isomerase [unclassified Curvibacter]MDD0811206.1 5-carboxymethyl-2-hydroxymuconate isomerase [Curvibacter sp. RS43]MDD0813824.1 5-carboxymethyl-2-hydroxymuconate isomerase [Curvibacter sp. HBC28]